MVSEAYMERRERPTQIRSKRIEWVWQPEGCAWGSRQRHQLFCWCRVNEFIQATAPTRLTEASNGPPEIVEARVSRIPKRTDSIKTPIIERKLPPLPKSLNQRSHSAEDKVGPFLEICLIHAVFDVKRFWILFRVTFGVVSTRTRGTCFERHAT